MIYRLRSMEQDDVDAWRAAMLRGDWEQAWRETDRLEHPRRLAQAQGAYEHRRWRMRCGSIAPTKSRPL